MPLDKLEVQGLGEKSYYQLYFIEASFFYSWMSNGLTVGFFFFKVAVTENYQSLRFL